MVHSAQGEHLILTRKDDVEYLYCQAAANGLTDAVVFMLDLSCNEAQNIAREWLGDQPIDQELDGPPGEPDTPWTSVCIGCVTRERASRCLARLAHEAETLIEERLPAGQFHVVALAPDGLTQTVLELPCLADVGTKNEEDNDVERRTHNSDS